MQQTLSIRNINDDDIKYLKRKIRTTYIVLAFFSVFSIVFPVFCIYRLLIMPDSNALGILLVILIFGFWTYATIKIAISNIKEKQNLLLQKKIEGTIIILEKEMVTIKGEDSDTNSYRLKFYSEIEEKHKKISIREKDYYIIEVGDIMEIEYFVNPNYIKVLFFKQQRFKYASFTN